MFSAAIKTFATASHRHRDPSSGQPSLYGCSEGALHRSTKGAFDFEAKPFRRVMAGRDDECSQGLAFHHRPAAGRSGNSRIGEKRFQVAAPDGCRHDFREFRGEEAPVIADHHCAAVQAFRCLVDELLGGSDGNREQSLHSDIHPQNPSPTIGPKTNRGGIQWEGGRHHGLQSMHRI